MAGTLVSLPDTIFDRFIASSRAKSNSDMTERNYIIVGPRIEALLQ